MKNHLLFLNEQFYRTIDTASILRRESHLMAALLGIRLMCQMNVGRRKWICKCIAQSEDSGDSFGPFALDRANPEKSSFSIWTMS